MPEVRDDRPLRRALRANALFSGASAAAAIALSDPLADEFEVRPLVLVGVGLALLGYALALTTFAGRARLPRALARLVVWADVSWVVGTVVVLAGFAGSVTDLGIALLVGAAAAVGSFALVQTRAMRTLP